MGDELQALETEVARFRRWADASPVPLRMRNGEWACGYPGWAQIYTAFDAFVATSSCRLWSEATTELILYVIARDDDNMHLVRSVARKPDDLFCLAKHAVTSPEWDAKWQIAAELGRIGADSPDVEGLLLRFVHDDDEYVRRRALLALADIESAQVAALLDGAWESGSEYQRVDVLYILWKMRSRELDHYLLLAEAAPQQYLVDYAARIRAGNPV